MIRGLRRRHRLAWAVLGPILAGLLAAAILLRPAPPLVDKLPTAIDAPWVEPPDAPEPTEDDPDADEQP